MILEWMAKWEPVWLAAILLAEWVTGMYQRNREYRYDENKDLEKKQRKTKTTKKTTTQPGGTSTTEETTETTEPINRDIIQ